jgi:hypothetical protein
MTFFSGAASGAKKSLPTLRMQDVIYQNACTGNEKLKLRKDLNRRVAMAKDAFSKIDVILCADRNASSKNKIIKMTSLSVRIAGESTGGEPEFDVEVVSDRLIEDILAAGAAWDVSLQTSSHKLVLQYFANEACVKSVILRRKNPAGSSSRSATPATSDCFTSIHPEERVIRGRYNRQGAENKMNNFF